MRYKGPIQFILLCVSLVLITSCGTQQAVSTGAGGADTTAETTEPAPKHRAQSGSFSFEGIFSPGIKTVQFYKSGLPNSYPILEIGSGDRLTLEWDDMSMADANRYQFTIEHFNSNWQSSNLLKSDFIDGMFIDFVTDFTYSNNTYVKYTHYRLDFPTAGMRPKISGNYILKVYKDDEDQPIITRRFYVIERVAGVVAKVRQPTYARYRETMQEIDFRVDISNLSVYDPYQDVKVVMRQNWRWDNSITGLRPIFVQDRVLNYNYEEGNLFQGVNEFRPFDTRDFRFKGKGIRGFVFDSIFHATLLTDEDRSYQAYYFYIDQNGFYTIGNRYGDNASRDGDYVLTQFNLDPAYNDYGDIFVFGALTNWQIDPRFKMRKSPISDRLEAEVLLKQGYYDYQYVTVKDGVINAIALEGSHWQTENNYHIFIYHRTPDMIYDRLVGYTLLNSVVNE